MLEQILKNMNACANQAQAEKMAAYMQNRFVFLGIPKPKLKEIIKPYLAATAKEPIDWDTILRLWNVDFREAQYFALEYLCKHKKQLEPSHIHYLKTLIITKSWWETVDTIDALVGEIVLKDSALKDTMLAWSVDDNIWLRRVAINYQQAYKEKTDSQMLAAVITANLNQTEFFINKAIGWSLREYSKTNPDWVRNFIQQNQECMAPLSIKEATKYLP